MGNNQLIISQILDATGLEKFYLRIQKEYKLNFKLFFMDTESITELLEIVREKVNIKEGKRGLIKFLAVISRFPNSPIKLIAQKSGFPVPICTAIRNEFIKVKWCKRTPKGTILTKEGEKVLKTIGGLNIDLQCFSCNGLGINLDHQRFQNQLETIKTYAKLRGPPNTKIDQSFATPETSLNRVLYMSHHYDLLYGDFAFIGDSDLTSIALSQFVSPVQKIVVFDIENLELSLQIPLIQE